MHLSAKLEASRRVPRIDRAVLRSRSNRKAQTALARGWLSHEGLGIQAGFAQERCLAKTGIQIEHSRFGTPDECLISHWDDLRASFLADAFARR